ncbi:MAG: hypothetical protein JRJ14_01390 [Deltaproteobacteria bacterium]|nr:hypothetical protein [Deltaproteobacteria bacterium]
MAAKAGGQSKGQGILKRDTIIQSAVQELTDLLPADSLQANIEDKIRKVLA